MKNYSVFALLSMATALSAATAKLPQSSPDYPPMPPGFELQIGGMSTSQMEIPSPGDGGDDTNSSAWAGSTYSGPPPTSGLSMNSHGAQVFWLGHSNCLYRIDMAEDLNNPQWFTLVDNFPSQGTNTIWRDIGYFGIKSQPGADPMRFYRITETTNAATPPTVTITVPAGPLSGNVQVSVNVTSIDPVTGATLFINGERVDVIDGTGTFVFDSTTFPDGPVTIFATAESQHAGEGTDSGQSSGHVISAGVSAKTITTVTNANVPHAMAIPAGTGAGLTFGIAYQNRHPYAPDLGPDVNWAGPWNGLNHEVILKNVLTLRPYGRIDSAWHISDGFMVGMGSQGNTPGFLLINDELSKTNYLRKPQMHDINGNPGKSKFNEVNFGFLFGHGAAGSSLDYTSGMPPVQDSYYPLWTTGTSRYDWVGFSQCDFGSANLKWMAILTCNGLPQSNFDDMWNKNRLPINNNLHLLLTSSTSIYMISNFGRVFADAMTKGTNGTPMTIVEAWFYAGRVTQGINNPHPGVPVIFRVSGWQSCWNDTIYNHPDPEIDPDWDTIYTDERQVYP